MRYETGCYERFPHAALLTFPRLASDVDTACESESACKNKDFYASDQTLKNDDVFAICNKILWGDQWEASHGMIRGVIRALPLNRCGNTDQGNYIWTGFDDSCIQPSSIEKSNSDVCFETWDWLENRKGKGKLENDLSLYHVSFTSFNPRSCSRSGQERTACKITIQPPVAVVDLKSLIASVEKGKMLHVTETNPSLRFRVAGYIS